MKNLAHDLRSEILMNGHLSVDTRRKRLEGLKNYLQKNEKIIHEALKKDLGKSSFESYATEIGFILSEIKHTLRELKNWTNAKKVKTPLTLFPGKSYIYPEPYGVVLIIAPWNYPFQQCFSPFIGALAAGNRIVIKPSEYAPHTSSLVKTIVNEIFDSSEVMVVEGGVNETQQLLAQKFDYIFFTGSTNVGKIIMKSAAEYLTPVTLELGGKSPCLIEESADLDIAAKRITWGKFLNAGQTCVAPDYVLVPKKNQELLISKIKSNIDSFYGEVEKSADYPRIINEKHLDRLIELIDISRVAIGGKFNRKDKFITPTVLKDIDWGHKIMGEEIFGPLLPLIPYEDLDEAMEKLFSLPKPLAFYLFTENENLKQEIMGKVSFGGGCVNDTMLHLANPDLPFGGVGMSGFGSYHGKKSFDTFTHYKSIFEQVTKFDIPLRYPPYQGKLSWLKLFIR